MKSLNWRIAYNHTQYIFSLFPENFFYPKYVSMLKHELDKGLAFPKARENAILMYLNDMKMFFMLTLQFNSL